MKKQAAKAVEKKAKKPAKVAVKDVEVKGVLAFQRTGQGQATFKTIGGEVMSNPIVQLPITVLPADYDPLKYYVTGEFIFKITAERK